MYLHLTRYSYLVLTIVYLTRQVILEIILLSKGFPEAPENPFYMPLSGIRVVKGLKKARF